MLPLFRSLFIQVVGWLVPVPDRSGWRALWHARLRCFSELVERGEIPRVPPSESLVDLRLALLEASQMRLRTASMSNFLASPLAFVAALTLLMVAVGAATAGFPGIADLAGAWQRANFSGPALPHSIAARAQDAIVGHLLPVGLALLTAVLLVLFSRLPFRRWKLQGWSFFLFKLGGVAVGTCILWIELQHFALGLASRSEGARVILALLLTAGFLFGFLSAVLWAIRDQRRRCPVCLSLMAQPVSLGSWASVYDPAAEELVCPRGHGLMWVPGQQTGSQDHWSALDDSWKELFTSAGHCS